MKTTIREYYKRIGVFKRHGYDLIKARAFVLGKAGIKNGPVLEVGTGKGHTAIGLAKRGIRFTTIDLDRESLRIARNILEAMGLLKHVIVRRMNAESLCFKNNSFDYVVSVNFVHHAERPKQCIREMARVAKYGVIIADLNKRGEKVMDRVHGLEGKTHMKSRVSFDDIKRILKGLRLQVKVYRDNCQTVFVAKKGCGK
jgi:ubiquinone/menaquinone biosynthesis C-methylase UbiE